MPRTMSQNTPFDTVTKYRVDWVDYAKGICIILVVMMHSTLGVEKTLGTTGFMTVFIDWARPFRMPDFFLISGLFLARRIDVPWREYLDKKLVHFLYFYVVWMTIQFLFKGYGIFQDQGATGLALAYLTAFIEPFGTLWFIYLLPVFFVAVKLLRRAPPLLVFLVAAGLEMAPVHTGWIIVDEFAARFVYFFVGYWLSGHVFRFADRIAGLGTAALFSALVIWGIYHTKAYNIGLADVPGFSLVLGFLGTAAVVSAGVILARFRSATAIRFLGENSIVVYLSFFVFMAASRSVLLRILPDQGSDLISVCVTLAAIVGPVILYWLTRKPPLSWLFIRPDFAKLPDGKTSRKVETEAKVWHSVGHDTVLNQPQIR